MNDDSGRRLIRYRPDLAQLARTVGGARYWTGDAAEQVLAALRAHREHWARYYVPADCAAVSA